MHVAESLKKYEHPYLTVDGVLFRFDGGLDVKLCRNDEIGKLCLPGGFVPVDRLAVDVLREKVMAKAGESGFYAEQLQTYDGLDRDPRSRVVSIAYLCLTCGGTDGNGWYRLDGDVLRGSDGELALGDLGFDHGGIVADARRRLVNKLWYSDLVRHLLPGMFTMPEIQAVYEGLEGKDYYNNFKRDMGSRLAPVGLRKDGKPGRKAVLYEWNSEWEV